MGSSMGGNQTPKISNNQKTSERFAEDESKLIVNVMKLQVFLINVFFQLQQNSVNKQRSLQFYMQIQTILN
jgi:hypothetical protein